MQHLVRQAVATPDPRQSPQCPLLLLSGEGSGSYGAALAAQLSFAQRVSSSPALPAAALQGALRALRVTGLGRRAHVLTSERPGAGRRLRCRVRSNHSSYQTVIF
jgi:hypothetical protein